MSLLAGSTAERRNTVKVMFYGQSITKQNYWKSVAAGLRKQFPLADLVVVNRALGGFASDLLKRTVEHDVIPFYPDLVIFHDYGNEQDYEWIIRQIRSRTTAEIAIQTDYNTWLPEPGKPAPPADDPKMKANAWHDRHCFEWLPGICRQYGLGCIDIRRPWLAYLKSHKLRPADLLSDGTHMNQRGEELMTDLTLRYLHHDPSLAAKGAPAVRDYVIGKDVAWKDRHLMLDFEGNRVDLMLSRQARQPYTSARVRIDDRFPTSFKELYSITRPSDGAGVDWPFVIHVENSGAPIVERWVLKLLETDESNKVMRYEVRGSVTGWDGEGRSTERFVSNSGRVVIEPQDWHLARAYELQKKLTTVSSEASWDVVFLGTDVVEPRRIDDSTREYPVTIVQGLANGKHRLTLTQETVEPTQLEAIRVYCPPVAATA